MKQFYKIKVGIEEFPVEETDIPRIVEAMKSNDMVKLDCGIFRGNAILAVCRDTDREVAFMSSPQTPEAIREAKLKEIRIEQKMRCELCDHTGWKEDLRGENVVRVPCVCTIVDQLLETTI